MKRIKIKNFFVGSKKDPLLLICGPCQIESKDHALYHAEFLQKLCLKLGINFVYKSSFDKANRTSIKSKRGVGLDKGLEILNEVKQKIGCPILTDVHLPNQCKVVSEVANILQIPAFLCRQTDLIVSAANTRSIVNIKKGQFLAPWDMSNITKKIISVGNDNILLTERGTSFGYNNLISDMLSLPELKKTGFPVIFDATHSVQKPGGLGESSGGDRENAEILSRAAIAVGINGLFIESHIDPENAPSDGVNMIPLKKMPHVLKTLSQLFETCKKIVN